MSEQGSVSGWIRRLGSDETTDRNEAARLIWERYLNALLALARDNLRPRIRQRENEEDVLQDMYVSFIRRQRRGEFDLANRDQLWGLLVKITLCKARNTAKKHRRRKRDVYRELPIPAGGDQNGTGSDFIGIVDRAPGPGVAAVLNEALARRLDALGDPRLRSLALKKLEGWTNAEIAASIGRTERSVERRLKQIRECWCNCEPALLRAIEGTQQEGSGR